jgi:hypothetical protein
MENLTVNATTETITTFLEVLQEDIQEKFILYISVPFIFMSIIGNVLNTIVFMRKKFQKTSSGFYFAVLSIVEIFQSYLVLALFLQQFGIKIEDLSNCTCKLHKYLNSTLPMIPAWLLVLIAFDRFILSTFLQAGNFLNNKRTQILASLTFIVCVSAINAGSFKFYDLYPSQTNSKQLICAVPIEYYELTRTFSIYNCFLGLSFLPFGLMTFANLLTLRKIISSKRKNFQKYTREIHFATTILTLNILFLVAYIPTCVTRVLLILEPDYPNLKKNHDLLKFFMKFFIYIRQAHSTFQIFFYFLVNKIFRRELIKLIVDNIHCMKFLTTKKTLNVVEIKLPVIIKSTEIIITIIGIKEIL